VRTLLEAIARVLGMAAAPARGAPARPSRALTILVAEDDPLSQRLAARLLERQGHTVIVAGNGREALAALDQRPVDLVLMDVQMPEMDGLDATASIRRREAAQGGHLPIVAMTAHARTGDRDRCLAAGMDGYLAKPVRADELYAAIAAVVPPPGGPGAEPAAKARAAAAGPEPAAPAGDLARALDRLGGNAALLAELAGLFLEERPKRMAALEAAIQRGDARQTAQVAHTLKSSLAILGSATGSALAAELERLGRERRLDGGPAVLASLATEVDRLAILLADVRRPASPPT
jgi:CheY-like chemotaxis protein/HPt (histidine-containing phosphotransfer) domain-containing protein